MRHSPTAVLIPALFFVLMTSAPAQEHAGAFQHGVASGRTPIDAPHARQAELRPQPSATAIPSAPLSRTSGTLTHVVHGYHPYWISDAVADGYRWDLLTHLAYFSCEIDPSSGEPTELRGWRSSTVIGRARSAGVKVLLTVTNFGAANNRTFLSSDTARQRLITRLVELLAERGAQGVNIDFESVPGDQRENLVTFFAELRTRLDAAIPEAVISVAAPAVDWNGAWDVAAMTASIDLFFVMCYDYSWSGSTEAGPVAPLRGMSYNVERTLRWYLDQGVPASKLLMGVPYYGYDWPVTSDAPRASATGRATARTYSVAASWLPARTRQWSETFLNPWISYQTSGWQQLWYDDAESLEHKYQHAKDLGIGGIGMWALGYDAGYPELWNLIERMFTRPASVYAPVAEAEMQVWPQPQYPGEWVTVRTEGAVMSMETEDIGIFDLLGRRVAETRAARIKENEVRYLVPKLASGVYVMSAGALRLRLVIRAE